ncbi:Fe-S cluster assembly protein SufD [Thauera phenolivorans]|nr:Fe-S cluster assembly protein SufD [Thauera phenolivorans]
MSALDLWRERHRALAPQLPGAGLPWLARLRARALERFADEGWPTSRQEDWRHTSLAFLEQSELVAANAGDAAAAVERLRAASPDGHWLVFVGDRFAPALSAIGALPAGVTLMPLADALATEADTVEAAFGRAEDGDSPQALNAAFFTDGALLRLTRGVALEAPVHLVFLPGGEAHGRHLRNLIVADAGAAATVVEHYLPGADGSTLTTAITRIEAGPDARIDHLKLQEEAEGAIHLAGIEARQARGARFASHSLSFGAKLARNDIRTRFDGEGCEALLNGLYHVDGRRHVDHHTLIEHASPRGTSHEFYRGLLDGAGRGVFRGRIIVAQDAQRSDAMQRCDNLLLSRQAEADARPELEIYADDVKCAHGATVGQLDEDSLFYLRARGLDEPHARQLLTYAFAAEALARIGLEPLRARARSALLARLPGGELLEALA